VKLRLRPRLPRITSGVEVLAALGAPIFFTRQRHADLKRLAHHATTRTGILVNWLAKFCWIPILAVFAPCSALFAILLLGYLKLSLKYGICKILTRYSSAAELPAT